MIDLASVPKVSDDVRFRIVDGEAVVIRQQEAEVLVLNGTGAAILQRVDGRSSIAAIIERLALELEVDAGQLVADVLEFFGQLAEAGIVEE